MHIFIMSVTYLQSAEKIKWKLLEELISQCMPYQPLFTSCSHPKWLRGVDFTKYVLSDIIQTSYCKNYKVHNSCNTDPSAPIFLSNMHCLMVMVWCKYRVQARGRLRQNTRPDGVNFALGGSGGEKTSSPDICSVCKKSLLVLPVILKTKWKSLQQMDMKFSDNLAKYI